MREALLGGGLWEGVPSPRKSISLKKSLLSLCLTHTGLPVFDASMMQRPGDAYNVFTLPVDAKVQATIAPTSRHDLVAILTHSAEMACIVMGVPGACIGMRGVIRAATEAEASSNALDTTLARLNFIREQSLRDVYVALYGAKAGLKVVLPAYAKHTGRVAAEAAPKEPL